MNTPATPSVYIYDEFDPESIAMMQSLYSRSPRSVVEHANKVREVGPGKFMGQYYVGYGHKSIGDCGTTTIFLENVSLLVAKAFQDSPLYNGQEASTRYLDFTNQPLVDPLGTPESKAILDRWMQFYFNSQAAVNTHVRETFPQRPGEEDKAYVGAVRARVFDIMRGFLPAGVTTFVSWHTTLRHAHDKLAILKYHPLLEVRNAAQMIREQLQQKYPNSFAHKEYPEQEQYREMVGNLAYNHDYSLLHSKVNDLIFTADYDSKILVTNYRNLLEARPSKTELPHFLSGVGTLNFRYLLDFGSYRDAQRHRNGVNRMPMLTTNYGFHDWYIKQLPQGVQRAAFELLGEQSAAISKLPCTEADAQYYIALSFLVPCHVSRGLPGAVYEAELRSSRYVHPTYRAVAQRMAKAIKAWCPEMAIHADLSADDWDVRRGTQTITERP